MTTTAESEQDQGQGGQVFGHPPLLSLTDAAQTCGVSRSTIRRRREEGAFPGAQRDASGQWVIPVTDLIAAGLTPAVSPPVEQTEQAQERPPQRPAGDPLMGRIAELETLLAVERVKREAAERLATERLDRVDDLRRALRVLEPAPQQRQITAAGTPPQQRRWWSRRP